MRKSDLKKIIDTYSEYMGEYVEKDFSEKKMQIYYYNVENPMDMLVLIEDKDYIIVRHCNDGIYENSDLWQVCKKGVKLLGISTIDDKRRESAELRRYRMDYEKLYYENAILKRKYEDAEKIIKKYQNKKNTKSVTELEKENEELRELLKEYQIKKDTIKVGRKKASEKIDMDLFKRLVDEKVKSKEAMKLLGIGRATYFRLKKAYCTKR